MTPTQQKKIVQLAGQICITTPRRPNHYSKAAYVDWELILELRAVLKAAGFDLDAARRELDAIKEMSR